MISHPHRCIFVQIQKCGGNSIRSALGIERNDQHSYRSAAELIPIYGREVWDSYFSFAFVRNPWERLVSWWAMIDQYRDRVARMNRFQRYVVENATTFEDFLTKCGDEITEDGRSTSIYRNQIDYLTLDGRGTLLVNFVGRFERLADDFGRVAARLSLSSPLPHLNRAKHRPYAEYYTPALKSLVAEKYERDIFRFGYKFGG